MGKLRILHVVSGLSREGGGISEAVANLAFEAAGQGHQVAVATVVRAGEVLSTAMERAVAAGVRLVSFPAARPYAWRFSVALLLGLGKWVAQSDVVHVHSNWTFPVWWACRLARSKGKPLVMTPHGCLNPKRLAYSARRKKMIGWLFDRRCLQSATILHVASSREAQAACAYLGESGSARIACVPCGVGDEWLAPSATPKAENPPGRPRVALCLGRLHPLKGVHLLIDAWSRAVGKGEPTRSVAPGREPHWTLLVVGDGDPAYKRSLIRQARERGLAVAESGAGAVGNQGTPDDGARPDIVFAGPQYGRERALTMAQAQLFVLPTCDENFGIVVAESLACGVPVIATKGAPWAELLGRVDGPEAPPFSSPQLASGRCGWWVDIGVEPLEQALREAMGLSDEVRRAMGENGRRLVAENYRWSRVASDIEALYGRALMAVRDGLPQRSRSA